MVFDLQDIVKITGGRLTPADAAGTVRGVSTDSRTIASGELFVPLRGENFDGHEFLTLAVRSGAAACLSEDEVNGLPVPVVVVPDTLQALGDLAAAVRRRFEGPLVGITGTSGKTTTKEMLAGILNRQPGLVTAGNYNNLIGLPLTLFGLESGHEWVVLEMGMSERGEITRLSEIARPTSGIITCVGPAHLETLHGIEGVARAKGELFAALAPETCAVINADDRHVRKIPVANGVRRLLFGEADDAEVRAEAVTATRQGHDFRLHLPTGDWPVRLQVVGRHNVSNALAAAAAAYVMGVAPEQIVAGLERFRACNGRMQRFELAQDITLLEDSYNANPLSLAAALETLDGLATSGTRIAVLGDMLELGPDAKRWHREVGELAAVRTDRLIVVGELCRDLAAGAVAAGMAETAVSSVDSHQEAIALLEEVVKPGARILVKGSRGMRMEEVSKALKPGLMAENA